ncbi:hypothetical protein GF362_00065 [Candidatus Dojkabacteria bacterium]|nr:hypothetical protein [Candidatus Dojkabacteria bacterium]
MTQKIPKSYGLNDLFCIEDLEKLDINECIREIKPQIKIKLIRSYLEVQGYKINLSTSETAFGGERLWFECPECGKRKGTLFKNPFSKKITCRKCLGLIYQKQKQT